MTQRGRQTGAVQFDLFAGGGSVGPDTVSAPQPLRPETLSDEDVIDRIPDAGISDVRLLCNLAVERGLGDRAVPALEALWRRFKGFGLEHPLPEQTAAIETLARLDTESARDLLVAFVTTPDLPPPLLPRALAAVRALSLRLPRDFIGTLLGHPDPGIRELAFALSWSGKPDIEKILAGLDDPQPTVRQAAAVALGNLGRRDAKATLLQGLRGNPTGEIAMALSNIADDEIIVHLGRCADAHPALANAIATELEEIETPRSLKIAGRIRAKLAETETG